MYANAGAGIANTGGSPNSTEATMTTLDYSALADGAALPSEMTFTTGNGEILGGGLKATDTTVGGGDYFEVDSAADGKFVARGFTAAGQAVSTKYLGVRFRISDPDNYHILMWQSQNSGIARIGKFVNGSSTYTDIAQVVSGTNAKPVFLVVASGSSIKAYIGDELYIDDIEDETDTGYTEVANITDTFNQTATKAGMRLGYTGYRVSEFRYPDAGGAGNTAPIADAGGNKTDIVAGSTVTMDFSGSVDTDGGVISTYEVVQDSGDTVSLTGSNTDDSRTYTAPTTSSPQDLVFTLTVTDDGGLTATDTVTHSILAEELNLPTVSVSSTATPTVGDTFTPTATASDYDSLLWACTSGQNPTFSSTTALQPSITVNETGAHTFRLTATNTDGSAFDEFSVTVSAAANIPPTANAGADIGDVAAGSTVQLDGSASFDGDGTIVSYAWAQTGTGTAVILTGASTATPSFTAPSTASAQTLTFELTVTDDNAATDTDTVDIGVLASNARPFFINKSRNFDFFDKDGIWTDNLRVTEVDSYTFTIDPSWISPETIIDYSVAANPGVTVESHSRQDNVIQIYLKGDMVGRNSVRVDFETATRSDHAMVYLDVVS